MLYYGVWAGFASYVTIVALAGSMILFTVAAPILVYHPRIGLYFGVVGCLLLLLYSLSFLVGLLSEESYQRLLLLASLPRRSSYSAHTGQRTR
jgi:hypothetical protein